jgi:hypothetical protein
MAADQRWRWWVAALGALALGDCRSANECNPGTSRPCTRALDGGVSQAGYQSCESTGDWSACVSVGGCRAGGAALPIYARCAASDECGPAGCAFCTNFQGVSNPRRGDRAVHPGPVRAALPRGLDLPARLAVPRLGGGRQRERLPRLRRPLRVAPAQKVCPSKWNTRNRGLPVGSSTTAPSSSWPLRCTRWALLPPSPCA